MTDFIKLKNQTKYLVDTLVATEYNQQLLDIFRQIVNICNNHPLVSIDYTMNNDLKTGEITQINIYFNRSDNKSFAKS